MKILPKTHFAFLELTDDMVLIGVDLVDQARVMKEIWDESEEKIR